MASDFQPFNLGAVLQTAEAIKAARSQSTTDRLREQYLGEQIQNARLERERTQRQDQIVIGKEKAQQIVAKAGQILQAENPKNYVEQYEPDLVKNLSANGVDWATVDDNVVRQMVTAMQNRANQELGVAPQQVQPETYTLKPGEKRFKDGQVVAEVAPKPEKQEKATARWRTLTAEELPQFNLPAGTTAQINEDTGQINIVSKRDTTSTLNQKDATTAKMKLNTVSLARQQLNNIKQRFGALKGSMSAGPFGQGKIPSEAGRAFDRSVDQMRSTLTALTRVPGVGAMSDYETKLDQAKFPTREEYESVTVQQIQDLDNMLNAIESGYKDLLAGTGSAQQSNGSSGSWAPPAPNRQQSGVADFVYVPGKGLQPASR